ncbi:HIT domain-containing protein [bacterium]|nr:HIT domain-containing protein [Porticoccaceae bacterium]MDB9724564.1 HIT domain-containing protein [bacterium]MDB9953240.1 HIT domain-containing protein [Porticoccaceae bacterium]
MFQLHEKLMADTLLLGEFSLSLVLLNRDANYPWVILVPKRADITEIYQLQDADRQQLLHESCVLAEAMQAVFKPDKLNIATIGNIVPQLHMHHVARTTDDAAWPGPVWGAAPAIGYSDERLLSVQASLQAQLADELTK